ncbi:uncharacterized protein LOC129907978 [Episyrphus balteatus]|uniref:uncharacterized protein LOC129907978 n=1 Tax=Episyrphus balteatus TaxID=286459 RepID=UPI0024851BE3|nr:uncharacterized protein LOC129907978 [Episyrphus balteatus]
MEKRYGKRRRRYEQRARRFMRRTRRTRRAGNIAGVLDQLGHLLKKEQEKYFSKEIACIEKDWCLPEKSRIESLKPILDGKMILRVGGRLERAEMEYERRHPAIVPNGSRLAWLIMHSAHSATKHGAVQVMMQHIRQKFWIPKIRSELRSYLHKCLVCVRHNHRFEMQLMADLPSERVTAGKTFLHTGVDYAGPFEIKMEQESKS